MTEKKVPERTCIGCRERKPQSELIRMTKDISGTIVTDETGHGNGRGAYICKSESCLEKALKTKAFLKTFKTQIDDDFKESLTEIIRR